MRKVGHFTIRQKYFLLIIKVAGYIQPISNIRNKLLFSILLSNSIYVFSRDYAINSHFCFAAKWPLLSGAPKQHLTVNLYVMNNAITYMVVANFVGLLAFITHLPR